MSKAINNSSKCEYCVDCRTYKIDRIEMVHCNDRDRNWIFGQVIMPCENYRKKDNKECRL